jgi:hypothetical protein
MTLEQELIEVFARSASERNREVLAAYYGWRDGRPHTLTEVGRQFGITRERVRQICAKMTKIPAGAVIEAPEMDRALALIAARLPSPAADVEAELVRAGITAGMSLEAVAAAARLLDRKAVFQVVEIESVRLAIGAGQERIASAIVDAAKKEVFFHGLTTVQRVARLVLGGMKSTAGQSKRPAPKSRGTRTAGKHAALEPLVRRIVAAMDGFRWLDEAKGWFYCASIQRHGLPKAIDKALSVAGELSVGSLRKALMRNRRLWRLPPPEDVLLEYCRRMPDVRIEGRRIVSDPPRDWRRSLTGVEARLVAALKTHGPIMERGEMEDYCVAAGMNRFSFHAFVSWSPVIVQLGHSVYGLLGGKVSRREVQELLARRRENHLQRRVLDHHGWTAEGKVWLRYRLSKAASTYAVITIPAALRKTIRGRFQLRDAAGAAIGTLATKDGRAWGLGAYLRKSGAHSGDLIALTLDLKERTATVERIAEEAIPTAAASE